MAKYQLQLRYLATLKPLVFSLTGGKDSQVSLLACSPELRDKVFAYTEVRDNDVEKAKDIASDAKINWIGLDNGAFNFENNFHYEKFSKRLDVLAFPENIRLALKCQFLLYNFFGRDNFFHIHSNGAETGRGRASIYALVANEFTFENYLHQYASFSSRYKSKEREQMTFEAIKSNPLIIKLVKHDFDCIACSRIKELGYYPGDFAYMETRNPFLLSVIHVLNDYAFESISLTNTRDILLDMWNLPDIFTNKTNVLYNAILDNEKFGTNYSAESINQEVFDNYGSQYIARAVF